MSNLLVYIISPIHIINAISSLRTQKKDKESITILIHWPALKENELERIKDIVKRICYKQITNYRIVTISTNKKEIIIKEPILQCKLLKDILVLEYVDEIYYSHNIEGGMFDLIKKCFPKAKTICYGDSLGFFHNKEYRLSLYDSGMDKFIKRIRYIKDCISKHLNQNNSISTRNYYPNLVSLILPIDYSNNSLKKLPLIIPEKRMVLEIIFNAIRNYPELNIYQNKLVKYKENKKKWILLTDNFAEAGFISINDEINMWISVIKKIASMGDIIIIKPHPGETSSRAQMLEKLVGEEFEIIEIEKIYHKVPIELFYDLIIISEIICMSSPILTLKYLYNKDVFTISSSKFIEKWFNKWAWKTLNTTYLLYSQSLGKIEYWDKNSILHSIGNINRNTKTIL